MRRLAGAALILGGCFVLIVEIPAFDKVIASVSWSRGLHISDLLGLMLVLAGTTLIWRA